MANELCPNTNSALAALGDKTTGDTLTAAEFTTLKDSVQDANAVTRTANTVFAGPTTGSAAQPTFRALVAADLPSISEAIDDRVAALLTEGDNITLTYDDTAGTLTIDAAGGGGSIDGSGTAGKLAKWGDADTLADSKLTVSGTNGGTVALYDDTAVTGASKLSVRAGVAQPFFSSQTLIEVLGPDGSSQFTVNEVGTIGARGITDTATSTFAVGGGYFDQASTTVIRWKSGGLFSAEDLVLSRASAGVLAVTDGSSARDISARRHHIKATSSTPTTSDVPTGDVAQYVKGGELVLAWNDAGTMRYASLTLGTDTQYSAWSTSAP